MISRAVEIDAVLRRLQEALATDAPLNETLEKAALVLERMGPAGAGHAVAVRTLKEPERRIEAP